MSKEEIKKVCAAIQRALGLENWRLQYMWFDKDGEGHEQSAAAAMRAQPEYFELTLRVFPAFFEEAESHQFEILLHEFSHALTEELYQTAKALADGCLIHKETIEHARERATSMTHLALLNLIASKENPLGNTYRTLSGIRESKK